MATNVWVAGPTEIHVGVGPGSALQFLGWAVDGVRVTLEPQFEPVHVDVAGRQWYDASFQGELGLVAADLAAWDEPVLAKCQARANPVGGTAGVMPAGAIGTLMLQEGACYPLLLYPPFVAKPTQAGQLPFRFLRAFLVGPDVLGPFSPRPKRARVRWRALPQYDTSTGSFTLYNGDIAGKPVAS